MLRDPSKGEATRSCPTIKPGKRKKISLTFYLLPVIELQCYKIVVSTSSIALYSGLLGITSYSRQDPEMAWCSFFAVQQQLFFGAINKTEVQKIDIKIEVEVSSWLWLD